MPNKRIHQGLALGAIALLALVGAIFGLLELLGRDDSDDPREGSSASTTARTVAEAPSATTTATLGEESPSTTAGRAVGREGAEVDVRDFGAVGDGLADDSGAIQEAIDAADPGNWVIVPPGTYLIESGLTLRSHVSMAGTDATFYMRARDERTPLLRADGTEGVSIEGLELRSDFVAPHSYVIGIQGGDGVAELTIRDLKTTNLYYGIAVGGSGSGRDLEVDGHISRGDDQSIYLAYTARAVLRNLDLEVRSDRTKLEHHLYIDKGNEDLLFENVELIGGVGYAVHLYANSEDSGDRGRRVTFRNLRIDANEGIVVWGYDDVRFEGLEVAVKSRDAPVVVNTTDGLTLDGFELRGGRWAAVRVYESPEGEVSNVTLRNGRYLTPQLVENGEQIDGLRVENVQRLGD
jgi:hypothetical protein